MLSHYLTEFQYSKVDEIEVPGQYNEVCILPSPLILRIMEPISGEGFWPIFREDRKIRAQV
jgi:hypothetical protein